jgi:hypothetical protein
MKLQIPSSNGQRSTKSQAPNHRARAELELGIWNFSGTWMLAIGDFPL